MPHYTGSCHCGRVKYSVDLNLGEPVLECNCSHCQRKGLLLSFLPKEHFELLDGDDTLTEYRFNTHKISHRFCSVCGVQCFSEGRMPDGSETRAINVRTIDDIDLSILIRKPVDGKSF